MRIPTPPDYHHHHHHFTVVQLLSLLITILLPISTSALETTIIVTITATATATTTTTTTTTNPQVPQDRSYTSASQFKSSILSTTNAYRSTHNASSLIWNETLASFANQWARTCLWKHSVRILPSSFLYRNRLARCIAMKEAEEN